MKHQSSPAGANPANLPPLPSGQPEHESPREQASPVSTSRPDSQPQDEAPPEYILRSYILRIMDESRNCHEIRAFRSDVSVTTDPRYKHSSIATFTSTIARSSIWRGLDDVKLCVGNSALAPVLMSGHCRGSPISAVIAYFDSQHPHSDWLELYRGFGERMQTIPLPTGGLRDFEWRNTQHGHEGFFKTVFSRPNWKLVDTRTGEVLVRILFKRSRDGEIGKLEILRDFNSLEWDAMVLVAVVTLWPGAELRRQAESSHTARNHHHGF